MKKKKYDWSALRYLSWFTQVGLNLIIPPVLYTFVAWYLAQRFGWSGLVVIVGILLGVATSFVNLYRFMQYTQKKARESERERKNDHR